MRTRLAAIARPLRVLAFALVLAAAIVAGWAAFPRGLPSLSHFDLIQQMKEQADFVSPDGVWLVRTYAGGDMVGAKVKSLRDPNARFKTFFVDEGVTRRQLRGAIWRTDAIIEIAGHRLNVERQKYDGVKPNAGEGIGWFLAGSAYGAWALFVVVLFGLVMVAMVVLLVLPETLAWRQARQGGGETALAQPVSG